MVELGRIGKRNKRERRLKMDVFYVWEGEIIWWKETFLSLWRFYMFKLLWRLGREWNEKLHNKELSKIKRMGMETSSEDITSNSRKKILTTETPQVWGKIVRLIEDYELENSFNHYICSWRDILFNK
jgi:hypothetical protein